MRAYAWIPEGRSDTTPVVLLPGRSSAAPMWGDNLPHYIEHRTVYAFDVIGDTGMSEQTVPMRDVGDAARWVDEAMASLDLDRVHLVGHSQGGGLVAAVAVRYPERLASLTLLEPVLTLSSLPLSVVFASIPVSLAFLPESWREAALNEIGGVENEEVDPDDPLARMITLGADGYSSSGLPNPGQLTDTELKRLPMPVYVAIASDSSPCRCRWRRRWTRSWRSSGRRTRRAPDGGLGNPIRCLYATTSVISGQLLGVAER